LLLAFVASGKGNNGAIALQQAHRAGKRMGNAEFPDQFFCSNLFHRFLLFQNILQVLKI
jgi:hypothetical protein